MRNALVRVLRLAMLVAILIFLSSANKGPKAQFGNSTCVIFNTDTLDCPQCCTKSTSSFPNSIESVASPTGVQSIIVSPFSCGTALPGGCSVGCSGEYNQAVSDSSCCLAESHACASNEPCCPGTVCHLGSCTACETDCPIPPGSCIRCGGSPIILDLTGNGFHLTDAAHGVKFDISGTGDPVLMGWTAQGSDNAFLALPGSDGVVNSGKELFGNFTPQPDSDSPNGFKALAVYDQLASGGNNDGVIDSRDAIFASLRLWIDANHDGVCQKKELHTLPQVGVNSIKLKYHEVPKVDRYGNQFRYVARVNPDDPDASRVDRKAYDVFFVSH